MITRAAFGVAIGLGACLLFQIQFLLARHVLPWFGGAPAVWSICLVVFQSLLLVGYGWAHAVARVRTRRVQGALQVLLFTLAAAVLVWHALGSSSPVAPDDSWKASAFTSPMWAISALLTTTVGLPFVALASLGPLLQRWWADLLPHASPYRLYALSNAGSLAGLLSYPLLVEPRFDLVEQGWTWAAAFAVVGAAVAVCAWTARHAELQRDLSHRDSTRAPIGALLHWALLAAVPSALLQATTTRLTQDIAAVPFLWMVPLALYLITFIVAFERPAACPRRPLALLLTVGSLLALGRWPTPVALTLTVLLLGVAGLALHGELSRRAPSPAGLTAYYLAVAAGGAIGSAMVALGAPLAFTRVIEYPLGLAAALTLLAATHVGDVRAAPASGRRRARLLVEGQVLAALVMVAVTVAESRLIADQTTHASRNFFGTVRVRDSVAPDGARYRRFIHGTTLHGLQFLSGPRRTEPTAYFTSASGIGRAMTALTARRGPIRVAVIGLGIGTLAAYGRPGDVFTFFEIDPQVAALSRGPAPPFTYVNDSAARVEIVVADGRLALERTAPLGADLLAMDAFSSDAVPIHLITVEAVAAYARHLRDRRSLLAVNISNRHLDLAEVVAASGAASHFSSVLIEGAPQPGLVQATRWMLLSRDPAALAGFGPLRPPPTARPWSDSASHLLQALHWRAPRS